MPEFPTEGIEIGPPTHIKESQLIDKFSAVWSVRDENGEWTPVSQGFFFIPRKQDIGHSIKVDVYPIRYHLKRPNPAEKNQMPTIDIIHVHNELVQVRSKLTPLDQACLDKQILYSLV
ncbi:hypothetical protein BLNAU_12720 [Blattamonas nauphoetae]|uniref:Uncharacterized protein n=1 Tax=Blattamonas nauphoetae TaxID=2049346 RepID=A0ABQ9XIQ7_9EUKA|nr:hypothetical protein BLNAU_12720 [Blattamonas nauphoetae]